MKIFVQWAAKNPKDWIEIDSREWADLPKGPVPDSETVLTDEALYINQINIQGVIFRTYDHYAIYDYLDGCIRVTCWNDDPEDHKGDFYAISWKFASPAYDHKVGCLNTVQSWIAFVEDEKRREELRNRNIINLTYLGNWKEFDEPESEIIRHGIWMPDDLFEYSLKTVATHGWLEWA